MLQMSGNSGGGGAERRGRDDETAGRTGQAEAGAQKCPEHSR